MKTFDGIKLVQNHLAKMISNYPEGSLTPRTVVATIPVGKNPEKTFEEVSDTITTQLLVAAEIVYADNTKLRRTSLTSEEIETITANIVDAIS